MALYRYIKYKQPEKAKRHRNVFFSYAMLFTGLMLLLWVGWPIISFQFLVKENFGSVISPIDVSKISSEKISIPVLKGSLSKKDGIEDYTDPNVWYPDKPQDKDYMKANEYYVSVPKLGIDNARVLVGGDSLERSLIHYGGTGLPGEFGNTVIFGHSTLPALYNPKDYKTIFTKLKDLKPEQNGYAGDEILVNYDGMKYKYVVKSMKITKPSDLTPLEQRYDSSYLTLVTCVPPGTYWERLNVVAELKTPETAMKLQ